LGNEPLSTVDWSNMVGPLSVIGADGHVASFLGTGFVAAASEPVFVTAGHLIRDNPLDAGERYHMLFQAPDGEPIHLVATAEATCVSTTYDVAAIRLGGWPNVRALSLDPIEIPSNEMVACREYSGNSFYRDAGTGMRRLKLRPRNHVGNVMSWYTSDFPERHPAPSCDLSFPALQGASGAPVLRDLMLSVVAILVANVEQQLEPAQVLSVHSEEGRIEETRYFLPIGKGLSASAIVEFLEKECGVSCMPAPPRYLPGELT